MLLQNCAFSVLVNGRPIKQFFYQDQYFIEGRGGSAYELEFVNHNPFRVEVVLSVDGLSVTDGRPAGSASTGYRVNAHGGRLRVPGWTLDPTAVAAFTFASGRGDSYVEQSTGSAVNKGVIGALVYQERPLLPVLQPAFPQPWLYNGPQPYNPVPYNPVPYNPVPYNGAPAPAGRGMGLSFNGVATSLGASVNNAASPVSIASSGASPRAAQPGPAPTPEPATVATAQTLGTGFGAATDFKTQTVPFHRGERIAMLLLYYDDLRGLKARGVPVSRARRPLTTPQAFPGLSSFCVPPDGWQR